MKRENMIKVIGVSILAVIGIIVPAYAVSTISGTVTSGGTGLNNAKVTAEQIGGFLVAPEYVWTRTSTTGSYSLTVNDAGTVYQVAAMLTGKQYNKIDRTPPTSTANYALTSILLKDAIIWVVADDGFQADHPSWQIDAKNIAYAFADGWFREEHSINMKDSGATYGTYASPNSAPDCTTWAQNARTALDWSSTNNRGAKIAIVVAGKDVTFTNGDLGCINPAIPSSSGTYPLIVVKDGYGDPAKLSMHEIGHAYSLTHSTASWKHVMWASVNNVDAIKNWRPADDSTIELNRSWYQ